MIGLIRQPCCPLYLLAVEREAVVVGNDVTPLCVLCIWVVLAVCAGGRFAGRVRRQEPTLRAEAAAIVFGAEPLGFSSPR
jgi:hypothetical protein